MPDIQLTKPEKIREIIEEHPRLEYLLRFVYKVEIAQITTLRVDGDNTKIDVHAGARMYRFKAKGEMDVLVPSEADPAILQRKLDPALAQAITLICVDHAEG